MKYTVSIHFRTTNPQSATLEAQAEAEGVSVAQIIRDCIDAYFAPIAPVIFDIGRVTDDALDDVKEGA